MEKKSRSTLLIVIGLLGWFSALGQIDTNKNVKADSIIDFVLKNKDRGITDALIIDGDTVPMVILDEILFIPKPAFDNEEARRRYYRLKKKVYKVYPWAVLAGTQLDTHHKRQG